MITGAIRCRISLFYVLLTILKVRWKMKAAMMEVSQKGNQRRYMISPCTYIHCVRMYLTKGDVDLSCLVDSSIDSLH